MAKPLRVLLYLLFLTLYSCLLTQGAEIPILNVRGLELRNAQAETTIHLGMPALKLTEKEGETGEALAIVKGASFHHGTIELEMSGAPLKSAGEFARGFIGIAFHIQGDGSHFENFYLRPTNGRADDQLRRNHTTQYVSAPDWPWERLRKETPGVYESYADIAPGQWIHVRVAVAGTKASLYVGHSSEPSLIVHDLKLGDVEGGVALWIGPGTEGYFRNLAISTKDQSQPAHGSNAAAGH